MTLDQEDAIQDNYSSRREAADPRILSDRALRAIERDHADARCADWRTIRRLLDHIDAITEGKPPCS